MTSAQVFNKQPIQWIPVKSLSIIWSQAQRPLNIAHARRIADTFDPDMFGTLAVAAPNSSGIYHIIDGQHRKIGIEMLEGPDILVPCEIYNDVSDPARAAEIFDVINTSRKKIRTLDSFKVRVTAGAADETAVEKIVRSHGMAIGERGLKCVQALLFVYRVHGSQVLSSTLGILLGTWGNDRQAFEASLVRGFAEFVADRGLHANWPRIQERIAKKYTPGRLLGAAKSGREMHGVSISSAVKAMLMKYDTRRRIGTEENGDTAD